MDLSGRHIAILCNPTRENEKALRITENVSLLLKGMGVSHQIFTEDWPVQLEPFSESWVMGGDGTINHYINQYTSTDIPIALFGGGSGNDFHWMLYGDTSVEDQVEKVLSASPRKVDAGLCNDRYFVNGVGIGFDGAIVKELLGKKKLSGKSSYLLAILKHIIAYSEKPCAIEWPGQTISQDCLMISVANGRRYGGGFHVAPDASVHDNLLDINIVGSISPFKRIRYLPIIEKGEHLDLPFVQYKKVPSVRITAPVKLHAHIDGEYVFESEFNIRILPERFSFLY